MHGKAIWIVGALIYCFAFMGGLFLSQEEAVTPARMFIAGNVLGATMVALMLLSRRMAIADDDLPEAR